MSSEQLAAGEQFGNYHIVRPIGGGGMAQIYLAKTRGLAGFEKYLALKVINPEYATEDRFIRMLIDEAKLSVGLAHANIAQVFDLGHVEGIYYIAMEYVDGCDVLELVNGLHAVGERLPIEAVAYIGRQICSGLHYAHARRDKDGNALNIVHRDISPQNILVSRNGEVKVVDFGIAKAAGQSSKTQAGVIKGKVNYMAPEQAMGARADARTDIFAVGIVMWEMVTAQMVYNNNNVGELVAAVRRANIPPPSTVRPEISPAFDAVVMKALAKRPEDRYQTAHQAQVALTKYLSGTAPDYSGSKLATLVLKVSDPSAIDKVEELSREELIPDHNSLIFQMEEAGSHLPRLKVRVDGRESHFPLEDKVCNIGRAGELALTDVRVSRQHARITKQGEGFIVEDLGSSNGTFVNNDRVKAPRVLRDKDVIRVGNVDLVYLAGAPIEGSLSKSGVPEAPEAMESKLVVTVNGRTIEHTLGESTELTYAIQIGGARLEGCCARVVSKDGGYWLEPVGQRVKVKINGTPAGAAVRLNIGDAFEIDGVTFRITNETRPFDAVSGRS